MPQRIFMFTAECNLPCKQTCHTGGGPSSTVNPFTGFLVMLATLPYSCWGATNSSILGAIALNWSTDLIRYANTTSKSGPRSTCALLAIRSVRIGNCSLPRTPEPSCHELLIQRSVLSLAANHQTHKVVFNLLLEEGLGSPWTGQTIFLCGAPENIGCSRHVTLLLVVSGMAGPCQSVFPESQNKTNTTGCTSSWERFGFLL